MSIRGLAITAVAGWAILWAAVAQAADRPNVLLIITDDQGWGDIRSHGNDQIDTPVLDRLAASGARFDRFYVSPVCAPTRASLLTGRYHLRSGVHGVTRAYETMRAEEVTLAEVFKASGYATGCFGKWHNGAHYPQDPNGQGFDEFFGFCGGHWANYFDTTLQHNDRMTPTKGYITDVLADAALGFIEKNSARPWFCYVPFNAPHSPFQVPDKYFDKYKARGLDDTLACVYGMVENIDDNIGRLLAKLDALRLAEKTIVLFLTDNGPNTERYNGRMRGRKGSAHEGGVRVPFFVRYPGRIKPGAEIRQITACVDVLPTLVELCGLPTPKTLPLDGKSLVPLLDGKPDGFADRMLFTNWGAWEPPGAIGRGAVRSSRWRAVYEGKRWGLFDMQADPAQKNDVAQEHPDVLAQFQAFYDRWFGDVTRAGLDPIPTEVGHAQRPEVLLPGHEAFLVPPEKAGISYFGRAGWTGEWIDNWTSADAYPWWPIDVVRPGRYDVTLLYCCPAGDVGAKVRVEAGGKRVQGVVVKPHDPPLARLPNRAVLNEAPEKTWAELNLGPMELPRGTTNLSVKALSKPGKQVMQLKAVRLRRAD